MVLDALTERLAQGDLNDPVALRAALDAHEMQIAPTAVHARTPSPHRPALLAHLAMSTGRLVAFLEGARAWAALYADDRPEAAGERYKVAVQVIQDDGQPNPEVGAGELQRDLQKRIASLAVALADAPAPPASEPSLPWKGNALAWDVALASVLETTGPEGRQAGASLDALAQATGAKYQAGEASLADLFHLWLPSDKAPGARFVLHLARALWIDVVSPRWERQRRNPAALAMPVHLDVARLHSRTFSTEDNEGQRCLAFPNDVVKIERIEPLKMPAYELEALNALVTQGLDKLGSLTAHKVLRWEVTEGHKRVLEGTPDARVLRVAGGWHGLAELLGMPDKMRDDLHPIVAAQAHCAFRFPGGGYGNLLSYTVHPAQGRRRGEVAITLGDALLPHFVFEIKAKMGESRSAYEAIRLVPMLPLPPFVGRTNEHGAQATLSLLVAAELRAQARELARQGGALLNFDELAQRAGVALAALPKLIDRWTQDGDDAPAFLKRVEGDRFTLGDTHVIARRFMVSQGQEEERRSKAGKRSVQQRRKGLP